MNSACLRLQRQCGPARRSCRSGFRKKVFGPLLRARSKRGGVSGYEGKKLFPKIASPVAPCRFGPSQESDTGALSIATSQIDATAACMYIGRDASDAHSGACSGPSAWRPASVEAPVSRVDKFAHAANSASPVWMRLRSWLRRAKVAHVVDAIDFGPSRNGGGSVATAAHSLGNV